MSAPVGAYISKCKSAPLTLITISDICTLYPPVIRASEAKLNMTIKETNKARSLNEPSAVLKENNFSHISLQRKQNFVNTNVLVK